MVRADPWSAPLPNASRIDSAACASSPTVMKPAMRELPLSVCISRRRSFNKSTLLGSWRRRCTMASLESRISVASA